MLRADIVKKYNSEEIADELIRAKEGDPELRRTQVRDHPELPHRADLRLYLCWDSSVECDTEDHMVEQLLSAVQTDSHKRGRSKEKKDRKKQDKKRRKKTSSSSSISRKSSSSSSSSKSAQSSASSKATKATKATKTSKAAKAAKDKRSRAKTEPVAPPLTKAELAKAEKLRKQEEAKESKKKRQEEEKEKREQEKERKRQVREEENEKKKRDKEERQKVEKEKQTKRGDGKKAKGKGWEGMLEEYHVGDVFKPVMINLMCNMLTLFPVFTTLQSPRKC